MSNPFHTGLFNCCNCPQPEGYDPQVDDPLPKYVNRCGCPMVIVECESVQRGATLCGHPELTDPSVPPKRYRVREQTDVYEYDKMRWYWCANGIWSYTAYDPTIVTEQTFCDGSSTAPGTTMAQYSEFTRSGPAAGVYNPWGGAYEVGNVFTQAYDKDTCVITNSTESVGAEPDPSDPPVDCWEGEIVNAPAGYGVVEGGFQGFLGNGSLVDSSDDIEADTPTFYRRVQTWEYQEEGPSYAPLLVATKVVSGFYFGGGTFCIEAVTLNKMTSDSKVTRVRETRLLEESEDTEEDALARATEIEGIICSSLYQLRTTSFSLTLRESKYTLKFSNLCRGRSYVACARLRRRKAFSGTIPEGEDTNWEEVEPDTFGPFQATESNTEDGVTTVEEAEEVDLPFEQGWEYEIVSAHVWPAGTPCECPTAYEPEEEE